MSNQKSKDVVLNIADVKQHGKDIILPLAGLVKIDEKGDFTIDDVTATLLLEKGTGFKLVKGNGTTVTKDCNKEEEIEEEEDEDDEEEDEDDGLDSLDLPALIDIAKESFKEEDYKKFKKSKKMMISFLRKNS